MDEADRVARPRFPNLGSVLLGSALTLVGVFGSQLLADGQDRAGAQRQARQLVYFEYLDAANDLFLAAEDLQAAARRGAESEEPFTLDATDFESARSHHQSSLNRAYVFGSDEAWASARRLAETLPASFVRLDGAAMASAIETGVDWSEFRRAYVDLLDHACREVPPSPRRGCGLDADNAVP